MVEEYIRISNDRIRKEIEGTLRTRPMNRQIYDPVKMGNNLSISPWEQQVMTTQAELLKDQRKPEPK